MVPRYFNHFSTDQKPCFNSQMAALVYGQDREMGPINLENLWRKFYKFPPLCLR